MLRSQHVVDRRCLLHVLAVRCFDVELARLRPILQEVLGPSLVFLDWVVFGFGLVVDRDEIYYLEGFIIMLYY